MNEMMRRSSEDASSHHAHVSPEAWDLKAVHLFRRVMREATDWKMVAPMLLASPFFQIGKISALRFILNSPVKNVFLRSFALATAPLAAGLGVETTFFSLTQRGLTHFFDKPVSWDLGSVAKDWVSTGMTLGFLKGVGFLGNKGMIRWRGLEESTAAAWTRADHRALWWASQASGYLGLVGAHRLEQVAGFRAADEHGNLWLDALGTHIALGLGTSGGRRIAGRTLEVIDQYLTAQANQVHQQAWDQLKNFGFPQGVLPAAVGPAGATLAAVTGEVNPLQENIFKNQGRDDSDISGSGSEMPSAVLNIPPSSFPPIAPEAQRNNALTGKYVVIGNRGEPAVRAIHTVREMGGTPIVFVSDADRESLHATMDGVMAIRMKGRDANDTYNNIDGRMNGLENLMGERGIQKKDVIAWEGWGFLSENADLVARYEEMGIAFAGAPSQSHRLLGDKVSARRVAKEAGVPIVQGSPETFEAAEAKEFARVIGYPVIVKGRDTGGGKGIRKVFREEDFEEKYLEAQDQAWATAKSRAMFVERLIPQMRHLEVQIIADGQGNSVVVGLRECSLQRDDQKVVEEDVSTSLDPEIQTKAREYAARLLAHPQMKAYKGPGTIEFIWEGKDLYFLEVNTRLQVEHTVTESVTGRNLLKAQLEIGAGLPLPFSSVQPRGHAIEVRINAEDPFNKDKPFNPSSGRILHYQAPQAHKTGRIRVRVDSGIEVGRVIPSEYDSMIAKLIVWGENRDYALEGLRNALEQFEILGVKTNIPFLKALVASNQFQTMTWGNTRFIEEVFLPSPAGKPDYSKYPRALVSAAIETFLKRKDALVRSRQDQLQGKKLDRKVELEFQGQSFPTEVYEQGPGTFLVRVGDTLTEVELTRSGDYLFNLTIDGVQRRALIHATEGKREVILNNVNYEIKVKGEGDQGPGAVKSPLAGKVHKFKVKPGDKVKKGDDLIVIEAMKNETAIVSEVNGVVVEVKVAENQKVQEGNLLIMIEPEIIAQAEGEASKETAPQTPALDTTKDIAILGQAPLERIRRKSPEDITIQDGSVLMDQVQSYFRGFDVPVDTIDTLQKIWPEVEKSVGNQGPVLQGFINNLIGSFLEIEALFTPANWSHWVRFRPTGVPTDPAYRNQLTAVLKKFGIRNLEPSAELDEALFRLNQSHDWRREKAKILGKILPWITEQRLTDLLPSLIPLSGLFVDGVPKPFFTSVSETQRLLQRVISGAKEIQSLEEVFQQTLQEIESEGIAKIQTGNIFTHSEDVVPFLISMALRTDTPPASQLAYQLLSTYHYREHYDPVSSSPKINGQFFILNPHPGVREKGLQLSLSGIPEDLNLERFETSIKSALSHFPPPSEDPGHQALRVIELVVPGPTRPEVFKEYFDALPDLFKEASVDRITVIFQKAPNHITYRTFEKPEAGGAMVENALLRGIHPLMMGDFRLQRWTENFNINHLDHVLSDVPNVYIYGAQAKMNPKDQRHVVIGEHRGPLTVERFVGERTKHRLISDLRHLKEDPNYPLDSDSRVAWSWLPAALKATGEVGNGFDPFSLGVMRASPVEMIRRFNLDEEILGKVAPFYDGKVKSVAEVERIAENMSSAAAQIRDQGIPAVGDIFIREPIEMSDSEIIFLAYRLAPLFVGKLFEKTTVHYKRWEDGKLKSYIAEFTIPGEARFQTKFHESKTDLPPHRVRTPLEQKILSRQAEGKPYVYETVDLFRNVLLEEFYPKGNVPEDPIAIQEMVLGPEGQLVPIQREWGKNDLSKVAFEVNLKIPSDPHGQQPVARSFMVIADDWTVNRGAMGRKEGKLFKAVVDRAVEQGIPQLYLAESVGAFIGFPQELWPFLHMDPKNNFLYVKAKDLGTPIPEANGKPLKELIRTGEPYRLNKKWCLPVTAIIGAKENNTESLNGSGMAGEAQDRAGQQIPTATVVMGTSVGITTYLAEWSKFIIMLKDSILGLTGQKAINNSFGSTYQTESEIHGSEVMANNGVASLIVPDTKQAIKSFLRWLTYQPVRVGEEVPRVRISIRDKKRNFAENLAKLIQERGKTFSTKEVDRALFDEDSIFYVKDDWGRRINTGYARYFGIPVGMASMEMQPKETDYPGALGPDDSLKFAEHIAQVNRLGLPFFYNDSLVGFSPRLEDHQARIIPAGAQILSALRVFRQPFINMVQPFGNLFGGAWVVLDKNINPNIVTVAFDTAQLGIIGSSASVELPKPTRLHKNDPALVKKARAILDLQNHPWRSLQVGSIHHLIEDLDKAPAKLHQILLGKMEQVRSQKEAKIKEEALLRQVTGALDIMGLKYALLPNGRIEMNLGNGKFTTDLESTKAGLVHHFGANPLTFGFSGTQTRERPVGEEEEE